MQWKTPPDPLEVTTMTTTRPYTTAEELLAMTGDGRRELIRGCVREMIPAGSEHGRLAMRVGWRLARFVEEHDLGEVFAAETGFHIGSDPDTVRAPDCAFVRRERLDEFPGPRGFWPGPPDLAVEVVSPGDRTAQLEEKVLDWIDAGTCMVVVIDPTRRSMTVHRSREDAQILSEGDRLDGGDVVPGWSIPVHRIFD